MKVHLDNGRRQIELEVENGVESFLETLKKALVAMNYTEADLLRQWSDEDED